MKIQEDYLAVSVPGVDLEHATCDMRVRVRMEGWADRPKCRMPLMRNVSKGGKRTMVESWTCRFGINHGIGDLWTNMRPRHPSRGSEAIVQVK